MHPRFRAGVYGTMLLGIYTQGRGIAMDGQAEVTPGTVLMMNGETGTAVQRFYSDGKYHATTGKVYDTLADVIAAASGRVEVIYDAPEVAE